jgi:predicted metal-dependent hydrolase
LLDRFLRSLRGPTAEEPSAKHYQLRRSGRAKRLRIAVYPGRIEVVAPTAMPIATVEAFVASHWQWAQSKLAELSSRLAQVHSAWNADSHMPYRGERFPLTVSEQPGLRRSRVAFDRHFRVSVPAGLDAGQRRLQVKNSLEAWYRRQVAEETKRVILQHAVRHGLHPRGLAVRDQKTRWGSCGPRGDININWRLILAPPAVLEYVVVHELCHLRHRNHAQPFWALVEEHLPQYRAQRRWLKDHGHTLMAVLAD